MKENQEIYKSGGITSLEKLKEIVDDKMVDCLFTEYFMVLTAKARLLDQISDAVDHGVGIKEIKGILYGTDCDGSDKDSIIV